MTQYNKNKSLPTNLPIPRSDRRPSSSWLPDPVQSELTKGLSVVTDSLAFASVVGTNYQRSYQVSGTDGHGPHPSCGPDVTSPVPVARSSLLRRRPRPRRSPPPFNRRRAGTSCRAVAVFPALSMALHNAPAVAPAGFFSPSCLQRDDAVKFLCRGP